MGTSLSSVATMTFLVSFFQIVLFVSVYVVMTSGQVLTDEFAAYLAFVNAINCPAVTCPRTRNELITYCPQFETLDLFTAAIAAGTPAIRCSASASIVTIRGFQLRNLGLTGFIDGPSLELFTDLDTLLLSGNSLTGAFPATSLATLIQARPELAGFYLDVADNTLTGSLLPLTPVARQIVAFSNCDSGISLDRCVGARVANNEFGVFATCTGNAVFTTTGLPVCAAGELVVGADPLVCVDGQTCVGAACRFALANDGNAFTSCPAFCECGLLTRSFTYME